MPLCKHYFKITFIFSKKAVHLGWNTAPWHRIVTSQTFRRNSSQSINAGALSHSQPNFNNHHQYRIFVLVFNFCICSYICQNEYKQQASNLFISSGFRVRTSKFRWKGPEVGRCTAVLRRALTPHCPNLKKEKRET